MDASLPTKPRLPPRTIGSLANFDVFSDLVAEFYKECKYKKAVKSFILKSLSYKLKSQSCEEKKIDPDLSFQQMSKNDLEVVDEKYSMSTTSDTLQQAEIEPK